MNYPKHTEEHKQRSEQKINALLSALETSCYEDVEDAVKSMLNSDIEVDFDAFKPHQVSKLLISLTNYGFVPSVIEGNDRELDENDFENMSKKCVLSCSCLRIILMNVQRHKVNHFLVPLIIFCGQHKGASLWSLKSSIQHVKEILELLLAKYDCDTLQQLLIKVEDLLLCKKLFSYFLPHLTRSNWKCNPGMKVAFIWCLKNISHPYVVDVFNEVLPPSLLFVDDFVVENRISGIKCLHHILDNVPKATVQWYGRAEVIYNALKNLVYSRDPGIITALYPCLLKLLEILEVDPAKPAQIRMVNRYDELYQLLLKEMDNEQVIAVRTAYSKHLHQFINSMGITIVRYLKSTVRILMQYLEVYDGVEEITRLNCLTALQILLSVAWPRMEAYTSALVKGIVRLLYNINNGQSKPTCKVAVIQSCIKILKQLYLVTPDIMDEICKPLLNHVEEIPALLIVEEIWKS